MLQRHFQFKRMSMNDEYISNNLSPAEFDIIRQTKATLAIEELQISEEGVSELEKLVRGDISREEFQQKLKLEGPNFQPRVK